MSWPMAFQYGNKWLGGLVVKDRSSQLRVESSSPVSDKRLDEVNVHRVTTKYTKR
ncbi:hypothetical protein PGB90_000562 [Kerria lacca]